MTVASARRHKDCTLGELVAGLATAVPLDAATSSLTLSGLQLDSRLVAEGELFLALFGRNQDGRSYIPQAIGAGAAAILVEAGEGWSGVVFESGVPIVAIDGLAANASKIAARFFGHPSEKLSITGITGTNGKTSCALFLSQALEALGRKSNSIGTLGYGDAKALQETQLTTPDAVSVQRMLSEFASQGSDCVSMEVSSIGLHQHRVQAVNFDTAVFTNLSRDHLDYHGTMEAYGQSKKKLFLRPELKRAVINLDDPFALSIINDLPRGVVLTTFSVQEAGASVRAHNIALSAQGLAFDLLTPVGEGRVQLGLLGEFNVVNVLAVAATLCAQVEQFSFEQLASALAALRPVPGRMQRVENDELGDLTVVVDYAHTPAALQSALRGLRGHVDGRIHCLFGAGGNRDAGKRPLMAEVAERYADSVCLSNDNPRFESPDAILDQIAAGLSAPELVSRVPDRALAIAQLIAVAEPGDAILIAGKGHETYQEIQGQRHFFDDVAAAKEAMKQRAGVQAK